MSQKHQAEIDELEQTSLALPRPTTSVATLMDLSFLLNGGAGVLGVAIALRALRRTQSREHGRMKR